MPFVNIEEIESREIIEGASSKFIHTDGMTFAVWTFKKGAVLPEHSHFHEQITKRISGEFEMTLDGETITFTDKDVAVIPPNAVHSGKAITDCVMLDIFNPVREDYRSSAIKWAAETALNFFIYLQQPFRQSRLSGFSEDIQADPPD